MDIPSQTYVGKIIKDAENVFSVMKSLNRGKSKMEIVSLQATFVRNMRYSLAM